MPAALSTAESYLLHCVPTYGNSFAGKLEAAMAEYFAHSGGV